MRGARGRRSLFGRAAWGANQIVAIVHRGERQSPFRTMFIPMQGCHGRTVSSYWATHDCFEEGCIPSAHQVGTLRAIVIGTSSRRIKSNRQVGTSSRHIHSAPQVGTSSRHIIGFREAIIVGATGAIVIGTSRAIVKSAHHVGTSSRHIKSAHQFGTSSDSREQS